MNGEEIDDTMSITDDSFSDDALAAMLADPDLWVEPDPADADAIVALIAAESGVSVLREPVVSREAVVDLSHVREDRARRRRLAPLVLSAAAGAMLVLMAWASASVLGNGGPTGAELTLAGTDLAPAASADAIVIVGSLGTRIDLDVTGLEPAPPGFYYEAWLRQSPEVGVSAGTFHLRGGDGRIELWAGVDPADYPLLTVTLQEEAMADSSGKVVLKGQLDTP